MIENWHKAIGDLFSEVKYELYPLLSQLKEDADRYQNKVLLAEGSEKQVFKAYDPLLQRSIAYAVPIRKDDNSAELFLREVNVLIALKHPNIVVVHDLGLHQAIPFFTMELVEGESLKTLFHKYSKEDLLDIFVQVCDAINHANAIGIVNLDLKPEHIIIGQHHQVKILDWGLAQKLDGEQGHSQYGGTPGYMAPEQLDPEYKAQVATDIYLLGSLLYSILFGKPPIEGQNLAEVVKNTKFGQHSPHHQLEQGLNSVLLKALALNPSDRYQSAQALREDMVKFRRGYAPLAENAGLGKQLLLLYQRHKMIFRITFLALLGLCLFTFIFITHLQQSELRARTNEQKALAAQQKTKEVFDLYSQQKRSSYEYEMGLAEALKQFKLNNKVSESLETILMASSRKLSSSSNYDVAMTFALTVLKNNPQSEDAWRHLGFIYLVRLDFEQAANCFQYSDLSICQQLKEICLNKFNEFGLKPLSDLELVELLKWPIHDEKWGWVQYHTLTYRLLNTQSVEAKLHLIKLYLETIQPGSDVKLDYQPEKKHLSLKGSVGLSFLHPPQSNDSRNIINVLDIETLDLSGLPAMKGEEAWPYKVIRLP